ncbi:MAG: cation:proton antiporter [Rhodocyclaceae bacterium]|jgi:Kef-type K+ transport system membrane component KefB|nr:cation:proton antiporter [Rhodocyclaceae bacterium]MCC6879469.1 cation:proton antiporter [Rhodocyclaceae bacterium]
MPEIVVAVLGEIAWPFALVLAWLAGELGHRWLSLPRISSYGIVGFLLAAGQAGVLPEVRGGTMALLANVAFGLILFELGYRINLAWLRANPWLGVTSLVESGCTFYAVFAVAQVFSVPTVTALLLASLAMSTSPAAVLRVVNEARSSGQVTERTLHLSAFNCVLALLAFKAVVGYGVLASAGSVFQAVWSSLVVVLVSAGLGALFGVAVPGLLRRLGALARNGTVVFALAVLLLTALTVALKFSPLLAALAFGLVARHRRVVLSQVQRNFGALGDLLTVLLFVFVGASLDWRQALAGIELALAVVAVRLLAKTLATTLFARVSGISWRKGALTGLALMPLSAFAILLLEQTRHLQLDLLDQVAGVMAIALLLEIAGPLLTRWALVWAGEAQPKGEA